MSRNERGVLALYNNLFYIGEMYILLYKTEEPKKTEIITETIEGFIRIEEKLMEEFNLEDMAQHLKDLRAGWSLYPPSYALMAI